jgi:hypothetical protein
VLDQRDGGLLHDALVGLDELGTRLGIDGVSLPSAPRFGIAVKRVGGTWDLPTGIGDADRAALLDAGRRVMDLAPPA